MSKTYDLVGKQRDEIYDIIKKAPPGSTFYVSKRQTNFLQLRADGLDKKLVTEYAQAKRDNANFPPGIAFFDPETGEIILADGSHRAEAEIMNCVEDGAQADDVPFVVHMQIGSMQEALLHASGGNSTHGKRRSRSDIENSVSELVRHPVLGRWSNGRLAKAAHVSVPYVEKIREKLEANGVARIAKEDRIGERNGKPYRQRAKGADATPKTNETDAADVNPADAGTITVPSTDANVNAATPQFFAAMPTPAASVSKADECRTDAQPLPQDSGAAIAEATRQFVEALKTALVNVPQALREPARLELLNTLKADSFVASLNSEKNNM